MKKQEFIDLTGENPEDVFGADKLTLKFFQMVFTSIGVSIIQKSLGKRT